MGFVVIAAAMFLFGFGLLEGRNAAVGAEVTAKKQEYDQLLQEQKSYQAGKNDLATLKTKSVQPEDLFSQDTHVVREIKALEDLSKAGGLDMVLQVAGTAKEAQPLKNASGKLYIVPYTLVLTGPFDKVLNFIDNTEHLDFVTSVRTLTIAAQKGNVVKVSISADFYIKQ